jgi:uncharacterized protein (DUF58 family)
MLTARGSGLLGAAVALWIGSQTFGTPELQIAAVAAVVLVVSALATTWLGSNELRTDRFVQPAKLAFGETADVSLVVVNRGTRRTARLRLDEQAPPALASPPEETVPGLSAGQQHELRYRVAGRQRGISTLGPLVVELSDPFHITSRTRVVPGTATVTVRPKVVDLAHGLPLGGLSGGSGDGRPRPRPGGEDVAEVREYVRGDPLRAIHWPSTAHRGKLMVRREESPQDPRATVLLDLRATRHRGSGPSASLETAVSAAASALVHLEKRGQAVALVDERPGNAAVVRPADAWLDHLAEVEAGHEEFRSVAAPLTAGTPVGSTLVAVVTTPDGADLQVLVRAGRSASTRVALVVDTKAHGGARQPDPQADAAAARLRAAGWRVAILRDVDELPQRWKEILVARRVAVGA